MATRTNTTKSRESRRRAKLNRNREASATKSMAGKMLSEITKAVSFLDTPDNSRDPGFAYGVMASALADAMAWLPPAAPEEALAQACLLWADIDNLEVNDHGYAETRTLFHRIKLRTFWLSGWIERQHGIHREDYGLDYFHSVRCSYSELFPHQTDAEVRADARLEDAAKADEGAGTLH